MTIAARPCLLGVVSVVLVGTTPTRADEPSDLLVRVGAWIPRLEGQVGLDAAEPTIRLGADLDLDGIETSLNGEFELRRPDRWRLLVSGFDFSATDRGTAGRTLPFGSLDLAPSDAYVTTLDFTSVATEVSWTARAPYDRAAGTNLHIDPLVGVRLIDIDHRLTDVAAGTTDTGRGEWGVLYGGLEVNAEWHPADQLGALRSLRLDGRVAVGVAVGGDGGEALQIGAGIAVDLSAPLHLYFGYRLLELDVKHGGYEFDAGLQGLFLAGAIDF